MNEESSKDGFQRKVSADLKDICSTERAEYKCPVGRREILSTPCKRISKRGVKGMIRDLMK
jgi:hypothetical protein